MTGMANLLEFLAEQLADAEIAWSVGTFGAIAEFTRDADEAATIARADGTISAVTARGGLRIEAARDLRPIASESLTSESWSHRVALCLPEEACAVSGRPVLTEIGPDRDLCAPRQKIQPRPNTELPDALWHTSITVAFSF